MKRRFSKVAWRVSILGILGFFLYQGPGVALSTKAGANTFRVLGVGPANLASAEDLFAIRFHHHQRLQTCDRITPYDQSQLTIESGVDVVSFVEDTTRMLHSARSPEDQLKVIANRFDHTPWSNAWDNGASILPRDPRAREFLRMQTDLGHAGLVLNRYNRLIENGKRQEGAALSAFKWRQDAQKEIERTPMRVLVRGYLPHVCNGSDQAQYGCRRGETLFRVHTILSPRIACRFDDKREQYAAVFWVRIQPKPVGVLEPRIIEVEANGQELVRQTYEDLLHRKKLSVLAPDVTETLAIAGLDPFRAPMMWRRWLREPAIRRPASDDYVSKYYRTSV